MKTSQNPPIPSPLKSLKTLTYRDYFKGVRKVTKCNAHKPDRNFGGKRLTNPIQVNNFSPPNFCQTMLHAVLIAKLCLWDQCSTWSMCPSVASRTDVAHGLIVLAFSLGLMVDSDCVLLD